MSDLTTEGIKQRPIPLGEVRAEIRPAKQKIGGLFTDCSSVEPLQMDGGFPTNKIQFSASTAVLLTSGGRIVDAEFQIDMDWPLAEEENGFRVTMNTQNKKIKDQKGAECSEFQKLEAVLVPLGRAAMIYGNPVFEVAEDTFGVYLVKSNEEIIDKKFKVPLAIKKFYQYKDEKQNKVFNVVHYIGYTGGAPDKNKTGYFEADENWTIKCLNSETCVVTDGILEDASKALKYRGKLEDLRPAREVAQLEILGKKERNAQLGNLVVSPKTKGQVELFAYLYDSNKKPRIMDMKGKDPAKFRPVADGSFPQCGTANLSGTDAGAVKPDSEIKTDAGAQTDSMAQSDATVSADSANQYPLQGFPVKISGNIYDKRDSSLIGRIPSKAPSNLEFVIPGYEKKISARIAGRVETDRTNFQRGVLYGMLLNVQSKIGTFQIDGGVESDGEAVETDAQSTPKSDVLETE